MSNVGLSRLGEIRATLKDALRGERDGTMRIPIADLQVLDAALDREAVLTAALFVAADALGVAANVLNNLRPLASPIAGSPMDRQVAAVRNSSRRAARAARAAAACECLAAEAQRREG